MNMLKFAKDGCWLVFGTRQALRGVAVLDAPVHRRCISIDDSGVLEWVGSHLHEPLKECLRDARSFDFVRVRAVLDLRPTEIQWAEMWKLQGCNEPRTRQGCPRLGGKMLARSLLACVRRGVHRTPYDMADAS